jgi:hypothetical protein
MIINNHPPIPFCNASIAAGSTPCSTCCINSGGNNPKISTLQKKDCLNVKNIAAPIRDGYIMPIIEGN